MVTDMPNNFAVLVDGAVRELFADRPEFHPSIRVVDVSDLADIAVGWIEGEGGGFAPPPALTAAQTGPRLVPGKALRYALNADGHRAGFEVALAAAAPDARDWWSAAASGLVPENSPKLVRLCAAAGIDRAALIEVATTV